MHPGRGGIDSTCPTPLVAVAAAAGSRHCLVIPLKNWEQPGTEWALGTC